MFHLLCLQESYSADPVACACTEKGRVRTTITKSGKVSDPRWQETQRLQVAFLLIDNSDPNHSFFSFPTSKPQGREKVFCFSFLLPWGLYLCPNKKSTLRSLSSRKGVIYPPPPEVQNIIFTTLAPVRSSVRFLLNL